MKEAFLKWMAANWKFHLAACVNEYRAMFYGLGALNQSAMEVDRKPLEGKVIAVEDGFVVVKKAKSRNEFGGFAAAQLSVIPAVGEVVRVTPYARKRYGGQRLDAPQEQVNKDGNAWVIRAIGGFNAHLPLPTYGKSPEFDKLALLIAEGKTSDGVRRIAHVLTDAGASHMTYTDPAPSDMDDVPVSISVHVKSHKCDGRLTVSVAGPNVFDVRLTGTRVYCADSVAKDDLAKVIVDAIDDGTWCIAKVDILQKAPKKVRAAA